MITSLDGVVTSVSSTSVVLEVGGVGYRVHAGPATLTGLRVGSRAKLHTHHLVREDSQALYGFSSSEELAFFELITTVAGVGPKVGLAIVSSRPVADLELAILQGDEAVLTAVSGVGKRLAGRIVLELREKVVAAGVGARGAGGAESEVVAALEALGYTSREGREAARAAVVGLPADASLEDRVKEALQVLRRD
ncbi:MAG TPA: Holliday junction branch migration protein RuvA [Candidatus Limnocylindrales bacterium]|nr:Holliday junction branch migration protein RuvA [Candidatus Limnocylindrales bacterium]